MKGLEFPIIGTKVKGINQEFDINSPSGRKKYFNAKVGGEIKQISNFLKHGTFLAFFLGKKGSGKGTYSKLFTEIFGEDKAVHVSVGDLVRHATDNWKQMVKSGEAFEIEKVYRGYISFDDAVKALHGRSTKNLLPTEFILALLKHYISKHEGKSIFIDGLPRGLDQLGYSLYFRELINYQDNPDFFILIDIPEEILDLRMKTRVVCPKCQLSRNTKLHITSNFGYDGKTKKTYLKCDNPDCGSEARMLGKEGDEKGLENVRERLDLDEEILKKVFSLHGVPKILLRNHIPVSKKRMFDGYEITPEFVLKRDSKSEKIFVEKKPLIIKDDNGVASHSLMAPAVVISMIKQISEILK